MPAMACAPEASTSETAATALLATALEPPTPLSAVQIRSAVSHVPLKSSSKDMLATADRTTGGSKSCHHNVLGNVE